jgi:hypothetical protein
VFVVCLCRLIRTQAEAAGPDGRWAGLGTLASLEPPSGQQAEQPGYFLF